MAINTCRVCGRDFFGEPLLRYAKMPKAAQNFPDAAALAGETGVDLEVCQCAGCGLVQLSNEPVPYYREVIRAAAVSEVIQDSQTRRFADFLRKYSLNGRKILEIGCGRGEFLSLLSSLDVNAYGLEYSESAVAECLKNGLHVSRGYPDRNAGALANGPFDAFLLLMFLEHMPEPNVALRAIYGNLADNAVGLVEVPNFDMVLRNKLFSEFIGDHLLYFTKETLQNTLQLNGFNVMEYDEVRDDYVISVVVKKRSRLDISHFHDYQVKIKTDIDAYLNRFTTKRVAVWGAGHQALAIIALTGIAGKIRYVVDSAPFKQGKYTPATHLPIVAPDVLHSDPVDAVIVMAASYSDEVAGIIRQRFDRNMSVAILRDFGLERV
jgi:2-polyprenyl-3-methyl-5-hydroxy-6-metoxy-1,4-benzoquinol methylase